MTNEECYERGWIAAIDAICKMLRTEAEQCIKDIVPGDTIGAREARARAGALLTAEADAAVMIGKITMPQRDFIDITGGPDACRPQGEKSDVPEFHFWMDARRFSSARKRLTGGEIKAIAGTSAGYPVYRDTGLHFSDHEAIGDGVLVDVDGAHFYALIPATYYRSPGGEE